MSQVIEGDSAPSTRYDASEQQGLKTLFVALGDKFTALFEKKQVEPQRAFFKAVGDRWFAAWTNNFEDRDGEWFSEKAIEEYVQRVDVGVVPMPELWLWHVPGTRHGVADMVGAAGHFAVASGTFDDTEVGRAAKAHYAKGRDYAMSHGFTYDADQKQDGVYHQFNTFELSVLPEKAAANLFTSFQGVKEMELSAEKVTFLKKVLGDEKADMVLEKVESESKAIEELGVRYKDFVTMSKEDMPVDEEVVAAEEDDEEAAKDDLFESVLEDVGVIANAVNAIMDKLSANEERYVQEGEAGKARDAKQASLETKYAALEAQVKTLNKALADMKADAPRSAARGEGAVAPNITELIKNVQIDERAEKFRSAFPEAFNR